MLEALNQGGNAPLVALLPVEGTSEARFRQDTYAKEFESALKNSTLNEFGDMSSGFDCDGVDKRIGIVSKEVFRFNLNMLGHNLPSLRLHALKWLSGVKDDCLDEAFTDLAFLDPSSQVRFAAVEELSDRLENDPGSASRFALLLKIAVMAPCAKTQEAAYLAVCRIIGMMGEEGFSRLVDSVERFSSGGFEGLEESKYREKVLGFVFDIASCQGMIESASGKIAQWLFRCVVLSGLYEAKDKEKALEILARCPIEPDTIADFVTQFESEGSPEDHMYGLSESFFSKDSPFFEKFCCLLASWEDAWSESFADGLIAVYKNIHDVSDDDPLCQRIEALLCQRADTDAVLE